MLTGKQRARLRALANQIEVVLTVGKDGVTPTVAQNAREVLEARELVKGTVLQNAPCTAREAATALCEAAGAEPVQVIGRRFVLYKRNEKEPKIEL